MRLYTKLAVNLRSPNRPAIKQTFAVCGTRASGPGVNPAKSHTDAAVPTHNKNHHQTSWPGVLATVGHYPQMNCMADWTIWVECWAAGSRQRATT